jgi:hypothetical protein
VDTNHSQSEWHQQKVAGVVHQRGALVNGSRGVVDSFTTAEEAARELHQNLVQVRAHLAAS